MDYTVSLASQPECGQLPALHALSPLIGELATELQVVPAAVQSVATSAQGLRFYCYTMAGSRISPPDPPAPSSPEHGTHGAPEVKTVPALALLWLSKRHPKGPRSFVELQEAKSLVQGLSVDLLGPSMGQVKLNVDHVTLATNRLQQSQTFCTDHARLLPSPLLAVK
ncbi:hypothetical protein AXG93_786s1130 [Marchantia polymorpha subsp. ruderalis]|uniref:Uncharacterized protein n=1 Tax=Marchantia polymorpha subsp. ruderalis TaxID=1480154 RepID=A0A176WKE0_MARPO|nr:hypothetical protein AXG93_786s1130 [Marchantia polymorpha subsp. ruderalis]